MTAALSTPRDLQAGLSLIEMLIVLVILGIATSAAVLSVGNLGRDNRVQDEAVRLVAHLTMAVDEGLVGRTRLALFWTPRSYGVKRWTEDGWQQAMTPRLAKGHDLPAALTLQRTDGAVDPVAVSEDGLGPAVQLRIAGTGRSWVVDFDGFSASARPEVNP